jgi:orotidine-5'-phosphate decarboxylase
MGIPPDNHNRIIIALDFPDEKQALGLAAQLDPAKCRVKVGKELFTACGPSVVEKLVNSGFAVFLDLKFHDIPHTVASACRAATDLGVWMINVHALGGRKMMEAAREAVQATSKPPLLIAVTILTSMNDDDIHEVGLAGQARDNALHLADLAHASGLDGVVCSAHEAAAVRRIISEDFILVTPGIRPQNAQHDDQKRVMTPTEAISLGSDYLVIGRPITAADNPDSAFQTLQSELENALTP